MIKIFENILYGVLNFIAIKDLGLTYRGSISIEVMEYQDMIEKFGE